MAMFVKRIRRRDMVIFNQFKYDFASKKKKKKREHGRNSLTVCKSYMTCYYIILYILVISGVFMGGVGVLQVSNPSEEKKLNLRLNWNVLYNNITVVFTIFRTQ